MKVPKRRDRVRTLEDSPVFKEWRGIEAVVLEVFEHPAGNLKLEIERAGGEKGIVEAIHVEVVEEAPPEEPKKLPVAAEMWIAWARAEVQKHEREIARLEEGIRKHGEGRESP